MEFFYQNVEAFKPYEVISSEFIKQLYNVDIVSFCDDYRYDFITSENVKYEVKTDVMSLKTGNYYVEFFGYNKPSALSISEADYYIFNNMTDYYMISVVELKRLVKIHGRLHTKTKDMKTKGYLIRCDIINDVSVKLN